MILALWRYRCAPIDRTLPPAQSERDRHSYHQISTDRSSGVILASTMRVPHLSQAGRTPSRKSDTSKTQEGRENIPSDHLQISKNVIRSVLRVEASKVCDVRQMQPFANKIKIPAAQCGRAANFLPKACGCTELAFGSYQLPISILDRGFRGAMLPTTQGAA